MSSKTGLARICLD